MLLYNPTDVAKRFTLNNPELVSIGKGLLITMLGAALTYITQVVTNHNFGQWTPVVMMVWTLVVNAVRKFLADEGAPQA